MMSDSSTYRRYRDISRCLSTRFLCLVAVVNLRLGLTPCDHPHNEFGHVSPECWDGVVNLAEVLVATRRIWLRQTGESIGDLMYTTWSVYYLVVKLHEA